MATCKRCEAEVFWAITAKGRRMCVDPQPRPDGNLAVYRDTSGQLRVRVVTAVNPIEPYERPGMPHVATCAGKPDDKLATTRDGATVLADARRRRQARNRQRAI